ncbi:MAG: hypothetical protein JWP00_2580 [Chloroflexi bacterium]|jgi:hypothetical protein|nr:hypothetical protein [Chloroflexota bacterium]
MTQPSHTRRSSTPDELNSVERKEGRRVILYIFIALVVVLVVGFLAGMLDTLLRGSVKSNVFLDNSREILAVIASTSPWIVLFIILCASWVFIADNLFIRWNRALGESDGQDKGMIYEIIHDNNAAAALVLMVPMLIIALGLIYVALLNLPYNLPTNITTR